MWALLWERSAAATVALWVRQQWQGDAGQPKRINYPNPIPAKSASSAADGASTTLAPVELRLACAQAAIERSQVERSWQF